MSASTLIAGGTIVTVDESMTVHTEGWLLVDEGRIKHVAAGTPSTSVIDKADRVIDARSMLVMPGLVNAHTHLAQTLMNGIVSTGPLEWWLDNAIRPAESAMTPLDQGLAALSGLVENVKYGVTGVVQHQKITRDARYLDATADAAAQVGVRLCLARGWRDRGRSAESTFELRQRLTDFVADYHGRGSGLVTAALGPTSLAHCSKESLRQIAEVANDLDVPIHIHVAENRSEVADLRRETGETPVRWLSDLGVLGPMTQLVHCVWLDDEDIELIAASKATVVHCPVSNLFLSSGICDIARLHSHGIAIALGTDGSASNGGQNILETAKLATLLARATRLSGLTPADVLRFLTMNGNRLVHGKCGGSLIPGSLADIAIFDLNCVGASSIHNPIDAIVFGLGGCKAHTVLVDGQVILEGGRATNVDEDRLIAETKTSAARMVLGTHVYSAR